MAKRQVKKIDYESLESRDLVWLVQVDRDPQAIAMLWARKEEVVKRLVENCTRKYTFVDGGDMKQSLALNFCKIVNTYRPGKANTDWDKYCYHRLTFMIKDVLRQRDDLGICWPQKKQYPSWFHLYDKSDASDGCHADLIRDHRHLSDEARDDLEFWESVTDLREAFITCRPLTSDTGNPASHKEHPVAWCSWPPGVIGGKYCWLPAQVEPATKRKRPETINPWRWWQERQQPKQLVMVF